MNLQGKTVQEAWKWASYSLTESGHPAAQFESEILLRDVLCRDRTKFFISLGEPFPAEKEEEFVKHIKRRQLGEPIQYITGEQAFYGRNFRVEQGVLIPRPETEILVEKVLHFAKIISEVDPLHLVDVGCGSGVIAITCALERPKWQVTAVDISTDALNVAKKNAHKHNIFAQIQFLQGSYLEPVNGKIDIVVSNPPYIKRTELLTLEQQISQFEPLIALDGGEDGLVHYQAIVKQISRINPLPRLLAFEVGWQQSDAVTKLFQIALPTYESYIFPDLAGHSRVVIGSLKS